MKKRYWILALPVLIALTLPLLANGETKCGTCGDNLVWTLTDNGTLTISGTGDMKNYDLSSNRAPWSQWGKSVKEARVQEGVTSIGEHAFNSCSNMQIVWLPGTLKTIRYGAFQGSNLTGVNIPGGVTSIGDYAFNNCSLMTSLTIPANVTSIGEGAFCGLTSLKSFTVSSDNSSFCTVDGVLFNKAKTTLVQCPAGKQGEYVIPNYVTSIAGGAFRVCSKLTGITIPGSVTSIGNEAFFQCESLTSITIPNSVNSFGYCIFFFCTKLESVTLSNGISRVPSYIFDTCLKLTSVNIPDSVTSIENGAFRNCRSLTNITIPASVTSIGDDAFSGHSDDLTISCYAGSKAQEYAEANNIKVKLLAVKPTITKQPASAKVNEGSKAIFKVVATDADSYQWYYRTSSTETWTAISKNGTSDTYTLTAKAKHNGYQFRCKVKNTAGSVKSKAVTLTVVSKPTITTQPSNKKVNEGAKATFKVVAANADSYQWYYRTSSSGKWAAVKNGTSATYTLTTKAKHNGYQFFCRAKNTAGHVNSDTVTLAVKPKPVITTQPANQSVKAGAKATFKVAATGAESYQWYYQKPGTTKWTAVSSKGTSATYSLTTAAKHNGYKFKCEVTNAVCSVTSAVVTLTVK